MASTFFVDTNGCEVNRIDIERISLFLQEGAGYERTANYKSADFLVFSTCAGTKDLQGASHARIKELNHGKKPGAKLVVAGCLPVADPNGLRSHFDGLALPAMELSRLEEVVPSKVRLDDFGFAHQILNRYDGLDPGKSYAIRIGYGCQTKCPYCIRRKVYPKFFSRPLEDIKKELEDGLEAGFSNITLTGEDTTNWGRDIGSNIAHLASTLVGVGGDFKINIHRLQPSDYLIDLPGFLDVLASGKVNQLWFSIQSASPKILNMMNRRHTTPARARDYLNRIRKEYPDVRLRCDFIVGHPGETDSDFAATREFIENVSLDAAAVFPYSAVAMEADDVPPQTKTLRAAILSQILRDKQQQRTAQDATPATDDARKAKDEACIYSNRVTGLEERLASQVDVVNKAFFVASMTCGKGRAQGLGGGLSSSAAIDEATRDFVAKWQGLWLTGLRLPPADVAASGFAVQPTEKRFDVAPDLPDSIARVTVGPNGKSVGELWSAMKSKAGGRSAPFLPYLEVATGKVEWLPYPLVAALYGDTGLAAAPSATESVLASVYRVLEHHCLREISSGRVSPPVIPEAYLRENAQAQFSLVEKISAAWHYRAVVADCSLGRGVPAVGILLIDAVRDEWRMVVGAAMDLGQALEKCLARLHNTNRLDAVRRGKVTLASLLGATESDHSPAEARAGRSDGFPCSLIGAPSSHAFTAFSGKPGRTGRDDLKACVTLIRELGFDRLFVRDCSFSGEPTHHVIVPGMSETSKVGPFKEALIGDPTAAAVILKDLQTMDDERLRAANSVMQDFIRGDGKSDATIGHFLGSLDPADDSSRWPLGTHAAAAAFKLGDAEGALRGMEAAVAALPVEPHRRDKDVLRWIKNAVALKAKGLGEAAICRVVRDALPGQLGNFIAGFFEYGRTNPFAYLPPQPNCFNCSECVLERVCDVQTSRRLYLAYKKNAAERTIDATSVGALFA